MHSRRALSALIVFALSSLAASAAPVAAQPATAAPAGPISDAQFQKIVKMIHGARGKGENLLPKVAAALGLANDGKAAVSGRLVITDKEGLRFQISVLNEGKGYLLTRHSGSTTRVFLMDANRSLVSGLTFESGQSPSTIPAEDAQKLFTQDLAAWARISDVYPPAKNP
jgi:hypothetical protein